MAGSALLLENTSNIHKGVVGIIGSPVEVYGNGGVAAKLTINYNDDKLHGMPASNLILLHYNQATYSYDQVKATLDANNSCLKADITKDGVYVLVDIYQWINAWGGDASEYAHDTYYTDDEMGFSILIPKGVALTYRSDYLKADGEGKYKVLLEGQENNKLKLGIEYLERPSYAKASDYANATVAQIKQNGYTVVKSGSVPGDGIGVIGWYIYTDFGDSSYELNCFYQLSGNSFVNVTYLFTDKSNFERCFNSFKTFTFD